ncbi:hypothetical protein SAMN05216232_2165 [Virgibacillus subterraneus]|uniref:Uncharacterized protein n=2 Tax=Virgibacillus TaxID=84406 RepID=A0A1H1E1H6_9BACI|nr:MULTISPECIES: hypothetical protein [Virgibacillus]SDQ82348.1 hypothetical protein SAMN05216231_2671 [Virgibacillus salinus]SEQ36137.1 hypothetical protein SAMN05216232_2165 [Virgibacillus subterraneus]
MWLNIIGSIIILFIIVLTIRGIMRDKNSSKSKHTIQKNKEKSNSKIKKEIEEVKRKQRPPEM